MLPEGSAVHQGDLVLPHAGLAAAGTYSCHGEDGGLLHALSLRLGCEYRVCGLGYAEGGL